MAPRNGTGAPGAGRATAVAGAPDEAPGRQALRLWLRLLSCVNLIEGEVRSRLRLQFDTTLPRFDLMSQLDQAPEGLTMGELSRRLMVSNGNVTGLIDRMAQEGLVRRIAVAGDRRSQRVVLTPEGKRAFDAMTPAHRDWIETLFAGLDERDMATLGALVGRLKESVEAGKGRSG